MNAGQGRRRAGSAHAIESSPVPLLFFEAADCLMALPVSEVTRLLEQPEPGGFAGDAVSDARVDLDEYFTGRPASGPWLRWRRREQRVWLRIGRVVEVLPYAVRALTPTPAVLRRPRPAGAFWAAGVTGGEIFLLIDPARFADPRAG